MGTLDYTKWLLQNTSRRRCTGNYYIDTLTFSATLQRGIIMRLFRERTKVQRYQCRNCGRIVTKALIKEREEYDG